MKSKYFKITPALSDDHDSMIIKIGSAGWSDVLKHIEAVLDDQFAEGKPWNKIKVLVECLELTDEEYEWVVEHE